MVDYYANILDNIFNNLIDQLIILKKLHNIQIILVHVYYTRGTKYDVKDRTKPTQY